MRIDPARSDPYSKKDSPAASAAAAPPLDPPGVRAWSHGFTVRPYTGLAVCPKSASMWCTFDLPTTIAPASCSRSTTAASRSATASANAGSPQVVGSPVTAKASLTVIGTPCSGPPLVASAFEAASSAKSRRVATTALTSEASMRAKSCSVSSRAESVPRRRSAATSVAVRKNVMGPG